MRQIAPGLIGIRFGSETVTSRIIVPYCRDSSEADTDPAKRNPYEFGRPCLAGRHRKRTRQRSRRDDLAGCEWRIDLIARETGKPLGTAPQILKYLKESLQVCLS